MNFGGCFLFPTESIRFRNSKSLPKTSLCVHIGLNSTHIYDVKGFSLGRLHMGRLVPPPYGGQVQGDKALMGGLIKGDIHVDLMGGGANFDRLYHKLKVLLMLSCNYTMQFIGYNSIKTR